MKYDENIDFVARHYRKGAFDTAKAWQRTGIAAPRRHAWRAAAAVALLAAVGATAGIYLYLNTTTPAATEVAAPQPASIRPTKVCVINFKSTPLPRIVGEIERVYKVKIDGLTAADSDKKITIHYQGDLDSMLKAINEIAGTNLSVAEQ